MAPTPTLSPAVEGTLREKAADIGQAFDAYATSVPERAATAATVDEILAPIHRQVAQSGTSDDELDTFPEEARDETYQERHGRSA